MKIAIYHNLPSGGAKRALFELVRHLDNRHTVDVFTMSTADSSFASLRGLSRNHRVFEFQTSRLFGSPWGRLNQAARTIDLFRLQRLNARVAVAIEQGQYDVVFVHPCQFENSPSLLKQLNTRSVFFCQEPLRRIYEKMPARAYDGQSSPRRRFLDTIDPLPKAYLHFLRRTDRRSLLAADQIVVNSKFIQRSVADIYGAPAKVLYLGVDTSLFAPRLNAKGDFVLSVGSLTPLKGFDFVIKALATIRESQRPPLRIVCNFEIDMERKYLSALAASLGVELEILRGISDRSLAESYDRALLTAYAPHREPFGLVAIESMAAGTPVVGVREGGLPETIVDGKTGVLVERDARPFGDAIHQLLQDDQSREKMGRRGRQHVLENWTWGLAARRAEAVLAG
ncbi:MAG: glycosyltransferase family 4 protein [Anaerolineales bacterium]